MFLDDSGVGISYLRCVSPESGGILKKKKIKKIGVLVNRLNF